MATYSSYAPTIGIGRPNLTPLQPVPAPPKLASYAIQSGMKRNLQSTNQPDNQITPVTYTPPSTTAPPPTTSTTPTAPTPPTKQTAVLDYSGDPILGQVKALNAADINSQEASTNSRVQQALLKLGSHDLAAKLLGANDPTLSAISEDPWTSTSTLGQLGYQNIQNQAGSNASAAANNSIFGSAHGQDLFDINRNYAINRQGAIDTTSGQISDLESALADFKRQALMSNIQAEGDAYQRAVALAALTQPPTDDTTGGGNQNLIQDGYFSINPFRTLAPGAPVLPRAGTPGFEGGSLAYVRR